MHCISPCGLCLSPEPTFYFKDKRRQYWLCRTCELVYVDKKEQLSPLQEKAVYDDHENNLHDEGYRRFLSRVSIPVCSRLTKPSKGLDFGCGPGPMLAKMLSENGHQVALYDLYYADDKSVFHAQYDFITCTEVIEHLAQPLAVLEILFKLLKPGASLFIMTKMVIDKSRFATWHYKNDLTHVSFFSHSTFKYVAQIFNSEIEFIGKDVIVLTNPYT